MTKKLYTVLSLLIIFQLIGCNTIYRSVRDKKERSYKEGVELFNQNKIKEANERFETVVDIEPEYRDAKQYLAQTRRALAFKKRNIQQRADVNYDRGVVQMKYRQYDNALQLLLLAKEQNPDQTDVNDKIDECRKKLAPRFDYLLKVAERQFQWGQYIAAYNTCLKAKTYDPSSIQLYTTMKKIETKLDEKAEKYVDRGKKFYDKKQFQAALAQYQYARQVYPWDEDIKEMIEKTDAKINLGKNYQNGITMYDRGDYFGAKASFNMVNFAEPNYKDTARYLGKIKTALGGQVGYFYNSGVSNYDKGNYEAAIIEFNKVLSINPGNTNAQEYRKRAQTKMTIKNSFRGETK
jgi:tetratricopeptide (TPR) repeat protein